ncbi:MAG: hypothetical protein KDA95_10450 [Acidimicrobiales bacterium]|nr:hypothetical protein [Acidimicrobiales bacterium]
MPSWSALVEEVNAAGTTYDLTRRKYLAELSEHTGRNTIVYYSGWLQRGHLLGQSGVDFSVTDLDKDGLMATVHQLDRNLGLDLVLHTPGGDTAATESLVHYLRQMFDGDVRAIVPHLALSAGTMIALSCREIVMGKHSSLGPIDPQIGGMPAHAVVEEWTRAHAETKADPTRMPFWQLVISKYPPGLIGACEKAIEWSEEMACEWLATGMFKDEPEATEKAKAVIDEIGSHAATKAHNRHISAAKAESMGLKVVALEDDQVLQEAVLTVHHACMLTMSDTPIVKLIENQNGIAYAQQFSVAG